MQIGRDAFPDHEIDAKLSNRHIYIRKVPPTYSSFKGDLF